MIVYNVSIQIEPEIMVDWIKWMKEKHIPDVMNTGIFSGFKFLKLLNKEAGHTFSIQYFCKNMEDLNSYYKLHAPALQEEHTKRYVNKFVAFRSIMEELK